MTVFDGQSTDARKADAARHTHMRHDHAATCPRVDVGAYEMSHTDLPVVCLGDLDLDGSVGASDLAIVLGSWTSGRFPSCFDECCPANLDGDGFVGAGDLAVILGAWGACPAPCAEPPPEAMMMAALGSMATTPQELSSLLGYDTLEAFAAWLGTLTAESRAAVLGLLGSDGGEL